MRHVSQLLVLTACLGVSPSVCPGQEPKGKPPDKPRAGPRDNPDNAALVDAIVARMMAFDKNKDGKLTRDEVTDERLLVWGARGKSRIHDSAPTDCTVVKPPIKPVVKPMRRSGLTVIWLRLNRPMIPRQRQPSTLMVSVPAGKAEPTRY